MVNMTNAVEILKKFEGLSLCPYFCSARKLTIGYGHIILPDDIFEKIDTQILIRLSKYYSQPENKITQKTNIFLKEIFSDLISLQKAEELLLHDLEKFNHGLSQLINVKLMDYQYHAVLSLCFNIGISAFRKSTLLKKLNLGQFTQASSEFDKWVYASGKVNQGLINRRYYEKEIFLGTDKL